MRKILLIAISGVSFCTMPAQAQFNTIAKTPERYKVEALQEGMKKPEPTPESMAPVQETSTKPADEVRSCGLTVISVCLIHCSASELHHHTATGRPVYRKEEVSRRYRPARTGRAGIGHDGGGGRQVGQDKTSGKYVTLRHGNYTVSYCHLSRVLTAKGTVVRPRDAVGITGSTGRSTGEHLHITCKLNGKSVDPSVVFDYIRTTQQECISALSRLL